MRAGIGQDRFQEGTRRLPVAAQLVAEEADVDGEAPFERAERVAVGLLGQAEGTGVVPDDEASQEGDENGVPSPDIEPVEALTDE